MTEIAGTVVIINRGTVDHELMHWTRRLPGNVILGTPTGNQIPAQRNQGARDNQGAWVLYVDSDSVMPYDTLPRLLSHDVEIVSAVVCERTPPWRVCAVRSLDPPARWSLMDLPREGLVPVEAAGTGCLLVRRTVFERLGTPWFRCGQIIPDLLLEDTEFCIRVKRELGIPTYLDAGCRVGHIPGRVVIWPGRDGRPWVEWGGPYDVREPLERVLQVPLSEVVR